MYQTDIKRLRTSFLEALERILKMRTDDVKNLTKDTVVMMKGQQCLLHPHKGKVYLLSDIRQYDGCTCGDFSWYRGQYNYSFWLVDKDDGRCDDRFEKICQQIVPYSLGEL